MVLEIKSRVNTKELRLTDLSVTPPKIVWIKILIQWVFV